MTGPMFTAKLIEYDIHRFHSFTLSNLPIRINANSAHKLITRKCCRKHFYKKFYLYNYCLNNLRILYSGDQPAEKIGQRLKISANLRFFQTFSSMERIFSQSCFSWASSMRRRMFSCSRSAARIAISSSLHL